MRLIAIAAVVLVDAAVAAKPPTKPAALKLMHERHENMEAIGKAVKIANRALRSDSPDLQAIRSSAASIAGFAPKARAWFPAGTGPDVGKTMAKPAIWQNPADFRRKMDDFNTAARSFNVAAKGGDLPRIRSAFANLGKTCKACHEPYRTPHED